MALTEVDRKEYAYSPERSLVTVPGFRDKIRSWREVAGRATGTIIGAMIGAATLVTGAYLVGVFASDLTTRLLIAAGLIAGGSYLAFKDKEIRPGGGH